jgi:hypothetical protein
MPAAAAVMAPLRAIPERFARAGRVCERLFAHAALAWLRRCRLRHLHGLRPRRVQSRDFKHQPLGPSERGGVAAAAARRRLLFGRHRVGPYLVYPLDLEAKRSSAPRRPAHYP